MRRSTIVVFALLTACRRTPDAATKTHEENALVDASTADDAIADAKADIAKKDVEPKEVVIHKPRLVRQSAKVMVRSNEETWEIVWRALPTPVCFDEMTCSCERVQYGEEGEADLLRTRSDGVRDVYDLGEVDLPRWPRMPGDFGPDFDTPPDPDVVQLRAEIDLLEVRDFDHDGSPDLLIDAEYVDCSHTFYRAVGIDPMSHRFMPLTTADRVGNDLLLQASEWDTLAGEKSGEKITSVDTRCGDHGSTDIVEHVLSWDNAGIHITVNRYKCLAGGAKGMLESSTPWWGPF